MKMLKDEAEPRDEAISIRNIMQKKFLEERKVFLWGEVSDEICRDVTDKFFYLESIGPGKEITFYMNTPGGSITAGMALYDTMKLISSPITVVVTGMAASMGSVLLCAAEKGKRLLYPHSRILIHQPLIIFQRRLEVARVEVVVLDRITRLHDVRVFETNDRAHKTHLRLIRQAR